MFSVMTAVLHKQNLIVHIYLVVVLHNVVMISHEFKCHEALNTIMAC